MGLFGRESEAQQQRAQRVGQWMRARTPFSLGAMLLAIVSVVDAVLLMGLVLGPAAVVLGLLGQRDIRRDPTRLGGRLCVAAITLGVIGFLLSASMAVYYHQIDAP